MKKAVLLGVVLALLPLVVHGEPEYGTFEWNDHTCRRNANYAKALMQQRQYGWSFTDSLAWIDEQLKNDPELIKYNSTNLETLNRQLFNINAREAYLVKVETLPQEKQRVITDFELESYGECMKVLER